MSNSSNESALQKILVVMGKRTCAPLTMRSPSEIIRGVATVTQQQHEQVIRIARSTSTGPGDLLRLARECAQDGSIVDVKQLDRFAAADVIETLRKYEYYTHAMKAA